MAQDDQAEQRDAGAPPEAGSQAPGPSGDEPSAILPPQPPAGAWPQPPAGAWPQPPAGAWPQPPAGAWPQAPQPGYPTAPPTGWPGAAPSWPGATPSAPSWPGWPGAAPSWPGVTPAAPSWPGWPGAAPSWPGAAPSWPGAAPGLVPWTLPMAPPGPAPGIAWGGVGPRLGALILDTIIAAIGFFVCSVFASAFAIHGPGGSIDRYEPAGYAILWLCFLAIFLYQPLAWWRLGGTPGQRALGLRVVRESDGLPLHLGAVILRYVVWFVLLLTVIPAIIAAVMAAEHPAKRAWQDEASGSAVIRRIY
jgi:uncharacterized RDD family membrane protein YckC